MPEVITHHLDLWTSALRTKSSAGRGGNGKLEAYGIKKLRELILELAVRGKLVAQDPNDEPASVLLERIAKEKARLTQEGLIKKEKPLPEIGDGEKLFGLPSGWEWSRLQDVSSYVQRGKGPSYADFGKVQVVSQKCIQWTGFDLTQARYVDDTSLDGYQPERFLCKDDLLWNSTGTGTAGRINVVPEVDSNSLVADSHVTIIRPLLVSSRFLSCYVAAPGIQQRIEPEHENSLVSGTTNQVELNLSAVIQLVVPVPPLAEQHRIVAKVDELMILCDQLEQRQTDSLAAHQTLVETLLGTLTRPSSVRPEPVEGRASSVRTELRAPSLSRGRAVEARPSTGSGRTEFEEAWARIASHFDTLFTTEASIDQLKQTLLQLAVMGKLVPQDSNDEPVRVPLDMDEKDEAFNLPNGWQWIRLNSLLPEFQNGASSRGDKNGKDVVVLRLADIKNWKVSLKDTRILAISEGAIDKYTLQKNDVLVIRVNGSADIVGRFILCDEDLEAIYCDHFIRMRIPTTALFPEYLVLLGSSVLIRNQIEELFVSTAGQKTVNQKHIGSLVITLPPLAEQHRIVAKVDELMALCDALKARIKDAQTTQLHLADAVVEQAVA